MMVGMPGKAATPWALLAAVVSALGVFALTFLPYANAYAKREVAGYAPSIVGVAAFAVLMTAINYWALRGREPGVRFGWAAGIAVAETVVFGFLFMFVLLNSFGS